MKTIYVTRTEPVFIEDEKHCSPKCNYCAPHIPRCVLFEVDIPIEEDGRPLRLPACQNAEAKRLEARKIEELTETACELATTLKGAQELADDLEAGLDNLA